MKPIRIALTVSLALAGIGASAAAASAATVLTPAPVQPSSTCAEQTFTQPFTAIKDFNHYTLAPGGTFESAESAGWDLKNGAAIVHTAQAGGAAGGVLDLPSGAQATSPVLCITSDYPTARLNVRNVAGSEGIFFYVSYYTAGAWTTPKNTGQFHGDGKGGWSLSNPMNVQPAGTPGWQQVRFTFVAGGNSSRFQADNFWVDPRMAR